MSDCPLFVPFPAQAGLQERVIDLCEQRSPHIEYYFHVPGDESSPPLFIKYGSSNLRAEARTQEYLHILAKSDPRAPRVPLVFDSFSDSIGNGYIVMQYVPPPATTLGSWVDGGCSVDERQRRSDFAISKVADIISWLHACPLPPDAGIGPVGGGVSQHRFFADSEAPMEFASADALQVYVNRALERSPRKPPRRVTGLSKYPLQFCHSDISPDNFLIDPVTLEVWLVDAQHISILPEPFASFALYTTATPFIAEVAARMNLEPWPHLNDLARAAQLIQMSADKSLGLDSYGRKKPVVKMPHFDSEASWRAWVASKQIPLPAQTVS
ncbi:hypothetical protein B0H10DRAFT_734251 [Mycena sp. CBHHK59/15]|nr:hypothetical protein B0H10DRAFT_734251 [Mycena sp. CBHHK59/15]